MSHIQIHDPETGEIFIVRPGMIAYMVDDEGGQDPESRVNAESALEVGMGY